MGFLDFVEQQDGVRMLVHTVGQKATLIEAYIAWRRTNQARDRMALHIFAHVETDQLDCQRMRQLARHFSFANASRAGEQITADRLLGVTQASAR